MPVHVVWTDRTKDFFSIYLKCLYNVFRKVFFYKTIEEYIFSLAFNNRGLKYLVEFVTGSFKMHDDQILSP